MKYNDYAIERLKDRLLELFMKKSTPKKYANVMFEAAEIIRQLKRELALPPNDPLTLEELREMDGMPVFVTKNGESIGYALAYSPCSIVYITCAAGSKWDAEDLIDEGCKFYRRKPEEEQ